MKEKEFLKEFPKKYLKIGLYYTLDSSGNVILDKEGMMDNLENELNFIEDEL